MALVSKLIMKLVLAIKKKFIINLLLYVLRRGGLPFEQQKKVPLFCHGKKVGDYFIDFLIGDQIVLELKVGGRFRPSDYKQLKSYLVSFNKPLGLLVRFGEDGVTYNRILPPFQTKFVDSCKNS